MISIYDWFGYDISLKERYRMIREAGFDGVMLWWSDYLNKHDYRSAPEVARKAGLWVENIHAPFQIQDDIWLNSLAGKYAEECYLQYIGDCAEFEIPTIVIHLPDDDKPYNALGINRIHTLAERAGTLGVNIAFENLHNLSNLEYVLEKVNTPNVGFCYDCSHHFHFYPTVDLLAKFGSRLMALHLHDYDDADGVYRTHRLPFDGVIEWANAMEWILQSGYQGSTAIEAMNWEYEKFSIEQFLHEAYQRAKRLEALRF